MPTRRPMAPADIRRQVVVEELDLASDGRLAIVARRSVRGDRYVSHLYAVPLEDRRVAKPRQLTSGLVRDGRPRLSPTLAAWRSFAPIRPTTTPIASIVVLDLRRGRQRTLAARGHGSVGEIAWSPDGRRLAFTAEVDPPRFLVGPVPALGGRRPRKRQAGVAVGTVAARPPHHPRRLALGRLGPCRPMVAPVRRRGSHGRTPTPGHGGRLGRGRHRLGAGRANGRLHRRPRRDARTRDHDRRSGRSRSTHPEAPGRSAAFGPGAGRLRGPPVVFTGRPLAGRDRRPRGRPPRRRQPGAAARAV